MDRVIAGENLLSVIGGKMNSVTCDKCKDDFDNDDVVWADGRGNLTMSGKPYCVGCLPEQPNYGGKDER